MFTYYHGLKYSGEWFRDLPHGNGEESWPDGTTYKGTYKEGLKDGIFYSK